MLKYDCSLNQSLKCLVLDAIDMDEGVSWWMFGCSFNNLPCMLPCL